MHGKGQTAVFPLVLANAPEQLPYLALGMVTASLRAYDGGALQRAYAIGRLRLGGVPDRPLDALYDDIAAAGRCICLMSCYVWNRQINLSAARQIKALNPAALIIIGGPEVPKYPGDTEQFLRDNPCLDIAVLGEGEVACAELLQQLAAADFAMAPLAAVQGVVFRDGEELVRTGERTRVRDLNRLPSPYLTGEFEPWFGELPTAILETNRGCPFGCTYCDWGSATLERVNKFDPQRVLAEIDYIARRQSGSVFIADANFGMLEQDIGIARALVAARANNGFPQRLYTNFAKNGGHRLMSVIKILHEGGLLETGIIALQTTDPTVLAAIQPDNIRTSSYEKLMTYFNAEAIPMASDIMIGLPGQTVDSLQQDLQFCFDWKVSANGNYTSMMPNAPMAERRYREAYRIEADNNGMIASTSTFSAVDLAYMKSLYMVYQFHVCLGIMKYYLYYLQLEYDVPAITLLRRWLDAVLARDARLPLAQRVYEEIFRMESRAGDWALMDWGQEAEFLFERFEDYCDEVHRFAVDEYDLAVPASAYDCLRSVQCAVMPKPGRRYPHVVELGHDAKHYFRKLKKAACTRDLRGKWPRLHKYPPGSLNVAPLVRERGNLKYAKLDGHADGWELPSAIRFYRPTAI